jgi:hypothetical protein
MTRFRAIFAGVLLVAALSAFVGRVSESMADFEVYWSGAGRAAAGEPLYRADDEHYRFKYLPAFAVLAIPLSVMPLPAAKAVWFGISVTLLVLLVAISVRLLPERRKPAAVLAAIAIVVFGKFYARELLLGQVHLLFAVLAASALLAMRSGREPLAGLLIGATIAIKPYGVLFVPWLLARRQLPAVAAVCVTLAVVALLPAALYGVDGTIALHRAWWATVTDTTPSNLLNPDNVSFASTWVKWLGSGTAATTLAFVTGLAAIGAAALVFSRRRGVVFPEALEGSLLLMLVPLLSPQGWDYVLLVATPAIVIIANDEDRLAAVPRTAAVVAALTIGLSLFDVMGRRAYGAFMGMAIVTVCASTLVAVLCVMRIRKFA